MFWMCERPSPMRIPHAGQPFRPLERGTTGKGPPHSQSSVDTYRPITLQPKPCRSTTSDSTTLTCSNSPGSLSHSTTENTHGFYAHQIFKSAISSVTNPKLVRPLSFLHAVNHVANPRIRSQRRGSWDGAIGLTVSYR